MIWKDASGCLAFLTPSVTQPPAQSSHTQHAACKSSAQAQGTFSLLSASPVAHLQPAKNETPNIGGGSQPLHPFWHMPSSQAEPRNASCPLFKIRPPFETGCIPLLSKPNR